LTVLKFGQSFGQLVDTPTPAISFSFLPLGPLAGENFCAWIKSCKPKLRLHWSKKFIAHKTIAKSGENVFRPKAFSGWHRRC